MPHASFKIKPGVDQNETPALNEAGLSYTNLVRFIYDRNGIGLVQKLGGWTKFYAEQTVAKVRAIWPWEDTNSISHLAIGTENKVGTYQTQLAVITDGSLENITPQTSVDNVPPAASSNIGSSSVIITDTTVIGVTPYDSVYITTHISIGGIVLFGLYACDSDGYLSPTSYTVQSVNVLGFPNPATSTSTTAVVAMFSTTVNSAPTTVTLPSHGYAVGNTYPILIDTLVGGLIFYGNYIVQSVIDDDNFIINANSLPLSTDTAYINNGNANFIYDFGAGALPIGSGYGVGSYGFGDYGYGTTITPSVGTEISASNWTLDNWGEILLACPINTEVLIDIDAATGDGTTGTVTFLNDYQAAVGEMITISDAFPSGWNGFHRVTASTLNSLSFLTTETAAIVNPGFITIHGPQYQPIYRWNPTSGSPFATVIANAPPVNDGMFVAMPQRQIIAWGSTFTGVSDPLLIRWCDVNNFNVWAATVINQAGSYRIPKGSRVVSCIQGPQQGLIWTDLGVWSMQYIGPPYVYSFNEVGTGCGLIARKAAASISGSIYWMGPSQFFVLSSGGVQPVPCPVWDVIFQDLDTDNLDKIRVAVNSRFGEISWFYPTRSNSGEVNAYVKFNVFLNSWDFGDMSRSAWTDQSVLGPPIGADPNTLYIYQHETSENADGLPMLSSFQTGYFAMSEADVKTFVDEVWPDMKWGYYAGDQNAVVNMTFYVTDFAGQTPKEYGPYPMSEATKWFSPRFRGRLVSIKIESDDLDSFWRIGNIRYRLQQDGRY